MAGALVQYRALCCYLGLKNAGLTDELHRILLTIKPYGQEIYIIAIIYINAFLSALMKDMPMVIIMDIAIDNAGDTYLANANILGCNLVPIMTPIGSFAALLWLHGLSKKGVKIDWIEYLKIGNPATIPIFFIALLGLLSKVENFYLSY